jgi:hypothetical protein
MATRLDQLEVDVITRNHLRKGLESRQTRRRLSPTELVSRRLQRAGGLRRPTATVSGLIAIADQARCDASP